LLGFAGALICAPPAPAEVSVEIDEARGEYLGYHVQANKSEKNPRVWSFQRKSKKGIYPLNTDGDLLGDGFPLIRENLTGDGLPWVVWDRDQSGRRVLVWSRWTPQGWGSVQGLEERAGGSQSDPDLVFNSSGRAYLAYVQPEAGLGVVRFTIFLKSAWALSIQVSSTGEDASRPSIVILEDATVEVTYLRADGSSTTRTVHFQDPGTITDDVYPFLIDTASVTEGILQ
jgi:hypothetical protein